MGRKFCVDCAHYEAAKPLKWYEWVTPTYESGRCQDKCLAASPDLVTGEARKAWAQWMRHSGYCGPAAILFKPR